MIKTISKLYNISSKGASNGSFKSQVTVQLPDLTFHHDNIQNAYFSVLHCEVPNSFYVVNYTCNVFVLNGIAYTIPVGNYNANTMITQLLSLIPAGFSITYSQLTNKYTFTHSTTDFTINAGSSLSTINKVLGLGSTNISSTSLTLVLPYVVNYLPLPRINFRSNYFKFGNYNLDDGTSDIFLPLQNNAGQQSTINYINQTQLRNIIVDRNITVFTINVTDDSNRFINFNNVDWYMTFQIDVDILEQQKPTSMGFSNVLGR